MGLQQSEYQLANVTCAVQGASGKLQGSVSPLMGKKWADMTAEERAAAEAAGEVPGEEVAAASR